MLPGGSSFSTFKSRGSLTRRAVHVYTGRCRGEVIVYDTDGGKEAASAEVASFQFHHTLRRFYFKNLFPERYAEEEEQHEEALECGHGEVAVENAIAATR